MRFLVASLLQAAVALAQDRGASEAAAVPRSMGLPLPSAYSRRSPLREEPAFLAAPWLALTELGEGGPRGSWGDADLRLGQRHVEPIPGTTSLSSYTPHDAFPELGPDETAWSFGCDYMGSWSSDGVEGGPQSSVVLAFELDGHADRVASGNVAVHVEGQLSIFAKLGIEPSFSALRFGGISVTLAMPLTMGFRLRNYFEDVDGRADLFGFLDLGAVASSPLPFLPSRVGSWHAELGVHWLLMGDSNEQRDAGESTDMIVSFGLVTTF